MSILKGIKSGFTLLELLIALAISAVILIGTYSMLDSVLAVSEHMTRSGDKFTEIQALERLILRDVRMMISYGGDNGTINNMDSFFSILSQNSLTFNKSIPVYITYYLDEGVLYREERNPSMNYIMNLPLLSNVESAQAEGYNGRDYGRELTKDSSILRFTFTTNDATYTFIAARLLQIGG
jgi:prepilin-type N-terminal cleavage/methylation domain-containing protein